jgi:hypothetical protein
MYHYIEQPIHDLGKALRRANAFQVHYDGGDNTYYICAGKNNIVASGLTKDEAYNKYRELTQ